MAWMALTTIPIPTRTPRSEPARSDPCHSTCSAFQHIPMVALALAVAALCPGSDGAAKSNSLEREHPSGAVFHQPPFFGGASRIVPLAVPHLELTSIPSVGSFEPLRGRVSDAAPDRYRIAVYIYVFGWWTKPSWETPLTSINPDGSWSCSITTGGTDECATRIAAFLVPREFRPPLLDGQSQLPAALEENALDQQIVNRVPNARTLSFSGYDWWVKSTGQCQWGPGPNFYSDSEENVWLDTRGRLHLRLTRRNNRWQCAEVALQKPLGHGTYQFFLDSRVDQLDRHVVLGCFTWSDDPAFNHREIDIEFSRWSEANNPNNAQFVVQPFHLAQHLQAFRQPANLDVSVHSFSWRADRVAFQSLRGHDPAASGTNVIREWTFTRASAIPPPGDATVHLNLWLFNGVPPSNGQEVEVIISRFEFIPDAPSLTADRQAGQVIVRWPATYAGFAAETARHPAGPWSPIERAPTVQNGQHRLTLDPSDEALLLRLRKP